MFRQIKKKLTMILTIIMYFKENSNISKRTKYKIKLFLQLQLQICQDYKKNIFLTLFKINFNTLY